jgi:neutral ceramidase
MKAVFILPFKSPDMKNVYPDAIRCGLLLIAATFWLSSASTPSAAPAERALKVGAYAIDITPEKLPLESAGSMAPRTVDFVHDRLHARCLVLDNGISKLAIATCDSCMIPRQIFDAAKSKVAAKTGIPTQHILCSATHTHSAITVTPTFQSKVESAYCQLLIDKIAAGIIQAHARRAPARIGWALGHNPRQVFNRRWFLRPGSSLQDPFDNNTDRVKMNPRPNHKDLLKPAGPIDPEVAVLAAQTLDGRPIALWANYSLHYVGGVAAKSLSADYFGEFATQISRLVNPPEAGSDFVAAMTNGSSADINNINFFEGQPRRQAYEQIKLVATDLAQSAFIAYQRIVYHDWIPLKACQTEIELDVRRPNAAEINRAKRLLHAAGKGPWRELRQIYANETLDLAAYPTQVKIILQAFRIGDLGICANPCETFVETGLAIKKCSPLKPSFTISLANGYNGYLPTPEQHALGAYETWRAKSSYLAVNAEPMVRDTLLQLLIELSK